MSIEEAINILNDILKTDKEAIKKLVEYRVPCNKELMLHKTVQVLCIDGGEPTVGLMGIINGIFGVHERTGCGFIGIEIDEDGDVLQFVQVPCTKE
jgi:hypothetical protein